MSKNHRADGRPVIGVTMDSVKARPGYSLAAAYAQGVVRAGGIPFLLAFGMGAALVEPVVDLLNGVLFIGGDDLDPALYGQARHPKAVPLDADRQAFELALLEVAQRRRLPILGICLGSQLINVSRGGSLHQHLPELPRDNPLEHRRLDLEQRRHDVRIEPGTRLHAVTGVEQLLVNTSHQQAVARLGRGLRATAWAPDGILEAFEDPTFPLLMGVQWHPERLLDEPAHLALFRMLVEHAASALTA